MAASRRRIVAALGAFSAAALFGIFGRGAMARYYDGPVSDHFDGTRFFDPNGAQPRSVIDLIRWRLTGTRPNWPDRWPSPYSDRPPAEVSDKSWRISFVGHASLLLQTAGLNLLIDPVWSERVSPVSFAGPRRVNDPGIAFDALPPISAYEPRWFMRGQHMNPAEAVQAFGDSGAALALAHHHGTFPLSDEAIDAPERALVEATAAAGIKPDVFRALRPGQVWQIDPA